MGTIIIVCHRHLSLYLSDNNELWSDKLSDQNNSAVYTYFVNYGVTTNVSAWADNNNHQNTLTVQSTNILHNNKTQTTHHSGGFSLNIQRAAWLAFV